MNNFPTPPPAPLPCFRTLLLLLPMVGLVEYFAMQRQMQERVRRANAAGTAVQVDPASRYMGSRKRNPNLSCCAWMPLPPR